MDLPPPPGASNIRSLTDQDSIFKAFDAYPWTKDTAFLSGLSAILGEPDSPGSPRDIATHARIFYYAQRIGVSIDFATYQQWLSLHPDHQPPDILPKGHGRPTSSPPSSATPWQRAAPKADLYVDAPQPLPPAGGGEPNYPMAFADMIKLIQEGKPIPGIRQIPNTIERDSSVRPVGSRPVPRKPWEKDHPLTTPDPLDLAFPPLENDSSPPTIPAAEPSS